jgi:hypothetical protein
VTDNATATAALQVVAPGAATVSASAASDFSTVPTIATMAPSGGDSSKPVSEERLARVMMPAADGSLRVSLVRDGLTTVVDGGMRLPQGVTQEYFITPVK